MEQAVALCGQYNIELFANDDAPVVAQPQSKIIAAANALQPLPVLGTQVRLLLDSADTGAVILWCASKGRATLGRRLTFAATKMK